MQKKLETIFSVDSKDVILGKDIKRTEYIIHNTKHHNIFTYSLYCQRSSTGKPSRHYFDIVAFGQTQKWKTFIFTNGVDASSKGHVSVYTQMMSAESETASEIKTWITMEFKDCKEISFNDYKITPGEICGVKRVKPQLDLHCRFDMTLIIINEKNINSQLNFTELLFTHKGDVILFGKDWTYTAHKDVLTKCSPVFRAMFQHDTLESKTGKIEINDLEGPVVKSMLSYLYYKNLDYECLNELADKLLVAADKYCIDDLKKICEIFICRTTTVNNVAQRILVADRFKLQDLRNRCLQLIRLFPEDISEKPDWNEVTQELNFLAEYVKLQLLIDNRSYD